MVGAGFSRFAEMPTPVSPLPPVWADLEAAMKAEIYSTGAAPSNPLRLAEEYRSALGQQALEGLIRQLVRDDEWKPGKMHARLVGLPWTDVLTTNWDTLLERSASTDPEKAYELVRIAADIARTRPPRIVKLHGGFPSGPFVFTEEDFRAYPTKFAPFVNLAQQVMLENEVCLLGFSGDDPNFLEWSGWVRDQLGTAARQIRLVGVLNLSDAKRRFLHARNVSPIDLAPAVKDVPEGDKHRRAAEIFLDALWRSKPRPSYEWRRAEPKPRSDQLDAISKSWAEDRKAYPGWVIAPWSVRLELQHDENLSGHDVKESLAAAPTHFRAIFAEQWAWRCDVALMPYPAKLQDLLTDFLNVDATSFLDPATAGSLYWAAARWARERHAWSQFDTALSLVARANGPDAGAIVAYEQSLKAYALLDYVAAADLVSKVSGTDPLWEMRKCLLQCRAGDDASAAESAAAALREIRERRTRDRKSTWLLSREAWAQWLVHSTRWASAGMDTSDFSADPWPIRYHEAKCDPWDTLQEIDELMNS